MYLTEQERTLKDIAKALNKLTEAVEAQNKLLQDVIKYPQNNKDLPPRLLIGTASPVQIYER